MRADYLPATAVCCDCGHLIHENQINACIEGTITYVDNEDPFYKGTIKIDPFTGYLCKECRKKKQEIIEGGIPAATQRKRRMKDEDDMGK